LQGSFEEVMAELYPALEQRLAAVLRDPEEARDVAQECLSARLPRLVGLRWDRCPGLALHHRPAFLQVSRPVEWTPSVDPDLWQALAKLEPRHRAALVLHAVDGYTQAELGRSASHGFREYHSRSD
jgi:DNA-directed RNA polymerase specialized sigma24 family protein